MIRVPLLAAAFALAAHAANAQASRFYLRGDLGPVLGTPAVETDTDPGSALPSLGPTTINGNYGAGQEVDYASGVAYNGSISGATQTNLAWTVGGGVGIPVADRLTVDVTHRWLDLGERRTGSSLLGRPQGAHHHARPALPTLNHGQL